jgi:CheY-like chemotaxis protein
MQRKKILLVDDSTTALLVEQMILGRHQYDLLEARNGAEGIARATAERPDLILLDVVMPGLDGLEALRRLRAEAATRDIPVILVTSLAEGESLESGWAAGCSDYVTKPVDALDLLSKVRSCLGQ